MLGAVGGGGGGRGWGRCGGGTAGRTWLRPGVGGRRVEGREGARWVGPRGSRRFGPAVGPPISPSVGSVIGPVVGRCSGMAAVHGHGAMFVRMFEEGKGVWRERGCAPEARGGWGCGWWGWRCAVWRGSWRAPSPSRGVRGRSREASGVYSGVLMLAGESGSCDGSAVDSWASLSARRRGKHRGGRPTARW